MTPEQRTALEKLKVDMRDNDRCPLRFVYRIDAILAMPEPDQAARESQMTDFAIACLKNAGVDITCGSCMEIAFTGVTTSVHDCTKPEPPQADHTALIARLEKIAQEPRESGRMLSQSKNPDSRPFGEFLLSEVAVIDEAIAALRGEAGR